MSDLKLKSLCLRTELLFPAFDSEVVDCGDYIRVRTPSNPNFYWGNYLIFREPPKRGDYSRWMEIFNREITVPLNAKHIVFSWDDPRADSGENCDFLQAGFWTDDSVILTAKQVNRPPKFNADVIVRPLESDDEWEESLQLQAQALSEGHEPKAFEAFKRRQMNRYRKMTEAKLGFWFGAFLGDRMVGDLGIFMDGPLGRFQNVCTHLEFRRRGVCGTLVHEAAEYAFARMGVKTLVMSADENYHAAGIYESVGFRPTEKLASLCRWERF